MPRQIPRNDLREWFMWKFHTFDSDSYKKRYTLECIITDCEYDTKFKKKEIVETATILVAEGILFKDGNDYLLTSDNLELRDEINNKINSSNNQDDTKHNTTKLSISNRTNKTNQLNLFSSINSEKE